MGQTAGGQTHDDPGHNHPSGAAGASESDRLFTADVLAALRPISITLLDHIIVAGDSAFSFADAGTHGRTQPGVPGTRGRRFLRTE